MEWQGLYLLNAKLAYRPDIDGLRAVAVLTVILYHAGLTTFSGGFVGVDVFFVISGFLITTQIVKEIQANEFSIVSFYERRIRRIFPAFFAVTICVLLAGAWLYDADAFNGLGQSAFAAALSLSNIFFWSQAGYFEGPSALKPLLHAWSLSVEEQFYLVLPILLFLIFRFIKPRLIPALILIMLASFGLNVYVLSQDPNSAYFFAHLRAWELLAGSLISIRPLNFNPRLRQVLSFAGIGLILASTFAYSDQTPFPGAAAIVPVLGAALIINNGVFGKTLVGDLLGTSPFVFIGKISYSLYLWHWPLIVFGKFYLIREPTALEILLMLAATLAISTLSWRFIEMPFRSKTMLPRPRIFVFAASIVAMIVAAGYAIDATDGFPIRVEKAGIPPAEKWNAEWEKSAECTFKRDKNTFTGVDCRVGTDSSTTDFLVWGDSHARALKPAFNESAEKAGAAGAIITLSGCPPLLGINLAIPNKNCYRFNNYMLDYVKSHPEIKTVILSGRWALNAEGTRYKNESGTDIVLADLTPGAKTGPTTNSALFELGLNRTIKELVKLNRKIVIVKSIPEVGYYVPSAFYIAKITNRDVNLIIAPTMLEYEQRNSVVSSVFARLQEKYKQIIFIDLEDALCDDQKCRVIEGNQPLYMDEHHLSTFGAKTVSGQFDSLFQTLANK